MPRLAHAGHRPGVSPVVGQPIGDLNITPLIDVMLVLLVMFILLVPTMTHKVPINLPQPHPDATMPLFTHRLVVARNGALSLDGVSVDEAVLTGRLRAAMRDPQAVLTMRTDPEARYDRFDHVLAAVKRAGVTRLGFEGHEAMAR